MNESDGLMEWDWDGYGAAGLEELALEPPPAPASIPTAAPEAPKPHAPSPKAIAAPPTFAASPKPKVHTQQPALAPEDAAKVQLSNTSRSKPAPIASVSPQGSKKRGSPKGSSPSPTLPDDCSETESEDQASSLSTHTCSTLHSCLSLLPLLERRRGATKRSPSSTSRRSSLETTMPS